MYLLVDTLPSGVRTGQDVRQYTDKKSSQSVLCILLYSIPGILPVPVYIASTDISPVPE